MTHDSKEIPRLFERNENLKWRLPSIESLAMLKMEKNFIAFCEKGYPRQPYTDIHQPMPFMINRIEQELRELKEAFANCQWKTMKEECADISNLVDYLFEELLQSEKKEAQK